MRAIGAVVLLAIVAILAATYVYGASRRGATTRDVRRRLDATRTSIQPSVVDFGQLAWLPGPAQEYFQTVLRECQAVVTAVWLEQAGQLDIGEGGNAMATVSLDSACGHATPRI